MTIKMFFRVFAGAVFFSVVIPAFSADEKVLCPLPEVIRVAPQKLNTVAELHKGKFAIGGLNPVVDGHQFWYLLTFASATDFNGAFVAGQENVKEVTGQIDKYAMTFKNMHVCSYIDQNKPMQIVMAIAPKQTQDSFGLLSFDPSELNPNLS